MTLLPSPAVRAQVGAATTYAGTLTPDGGTLSNSMIILSPTSTFSYVVPNFLASGRYLSNGVYYMALPNGNPFGYYTFLNGTDYIYHFDMGYEGILDAEDTHDGIYLYDFASQTFFYTSPNFPFSHLYDFKLNTVLYYFPDPNNPGRYNTDGVRYFYNFATGQVITK